MRPGSVLKAATASRCASSSSPTRPRTRPPPPCAEAGATGSDEHTPARVTMSDAARGPADADNLADKFEHHPAVIVVCADLADTIPTDNNLGRLSIVGGASVYPMVPNFCLALRNQGVATTLTTILCAYEPQVKELLGIPANLSTAAFVVAGYPAKPFPTKLLRQPVEEGHALCLGLRTYGAEGREVLDVQVGHRAGDVENDTGGDRLLLADLMERGHQVGPGSSWA